MVLTSSSPKTEVNFHDPAVRVRINPETVMRFEDSQWVTLQNIACSEAVRIQSDIMLVLYPMTQWITVGELCESWPPDDQVKIMDHLAMLYKGQVIITEEDQMPGESPSSLPVHLGGKITINVENHHVMLRDSIRMACYRRAIEKTVTPDSIVMDLGAGSGILSFFAGKAGARKIYAVEKRPDMVLVAKELAKANGLDDRITFVENSSHLVQASVIDPKPDVLVAEILGNAILEENVLEFTIDARDRFLAPGARMIPHGLDILVAAFDSGPTVDKAQEVAELEDIYGLDFNVLKTVLAHKPSTKLDRFTPHLYTMMSKPVKAIYLDLYTIQSPIFQTAFSFTALQDGYVNGFCAYFKAHMDDSNEIMLTNSPWAPPTHWTQMVYHFPARRPVKAGETMDMEMSYDGSLGIWFKE
jgi:predicted RNA methylase